MLNIELLQISIAQGAKDFPNEVVHIYYSKELNEFTTVPERHADKVLFTEPNLTLIGKYLNGKVIK